MNVPDAAKALTRYRIMAWVVGLLLIVLTCIGMPMKYIWHNDVVVGTVGVAHGWLYVLLLLAAFDLKRRVNWSWGWFVAIALAGTIPFLSFVAEYFATRNVRRQFDQARERRAARDSAPEK